MPRCKNGRHAFLRGTVRCLAGDGRAAGAGRGGVRARRRASAARGWSSTAAAMAMEVVNETEVPEGLDRAGRAAAQPALHAPARARRRRALHLAAARARAARRSTPGPCSPREADDAVLGAAIMLPDHPQLAPESRGGMFDSTEIEEALLLHVMALSDAEREQATDPAVRAMIERVATHDARGADGAARPRHRCATPSRASARRPSTASPTGRATPSCCGPGPGRNAQDHLVQGRRATVERIYVDFDGRVQLAVTVDDVPGQDIMRDIRRYLFFRPDEVEVPHEPRLREADPRRRRRQRVDAGRRLRLGGRAAARAARAAAPA